jgi:hypothetical protein
VLVLPPFKNANQPTVTWPQAKARVAKANAMAFGSRDFLIIFIKIFRTYRNPNPLLGSV